MLHSFLIRVYFHEKCSKNCYSLESLLRRTRLPRRTVWREVAWFRLYFLMMLTDSGFITTREYWMIYREPGLLASYDSSPPPPPPVSKLGCRHTGILRKRDRLQAGEGGSQIRTGEKAWSSINHSRFSGVDLLNWIVYITKENLNNTVLWQGISAQQVCHWPSFNSMEEDNIF